MLSLRLSIHLFVWLFFYCQHANGFSCYGDDGKPTNWFAIDKLQRVSKTGRDVSDKSVKLPEDLQRGANYFYADDRNQNMILSKLNIDDSTNALGRTLSVHFQNVDSADYFYIRYDDQDRKTTWTFEDVVLGKSVPKGHLKGNIFGSKTEPLFVLLLVSIPTFGGKNAYQYSDRDLRNAQHAICLTLKKDQLEAVLDALYNMNIKVQDAKIPRWLQEINDSWKDFETSGKSNLRPLDNVKNVDRLTLTTPNNTPFTWFVKAGTADEDIYSHIADALDTPLSVRTFRHASGGKLDNKCGGKNTVTNICTMAFAVEVDNDNVQILPRPTKDHTKQAFSTDAQKPYVCWCDLNRQETQNDRGGGCLCLMHHSIWKFFTDAIDDQEYCSSKYKCEGNTMTEPSSLLEPNGDDDDDKTGWFVDITSLIVEITFSIPASERSEKTEL